MLLARSVKAEKTIPKIKNLNLQRHRARLLWLVTAKCLHGPSQ